MVVLFPEIGGVDVAEEEDGLLFEVVVGCVADADVEVSAGIAIAAAAVDVCCVGAAF